MCIWDRVLQRSPIGLMVKEKNRGNKMLMIVGSALIHENINELPCFFPGGESVGALG